MVRRRKAVVALFILIVLVSASAAIWYLTDRTSFLQSACHAGLPNFSLPAGVDEERLGCAILGPKAHYSGLLATGFEASSFRSADFPPAASEYGPADDRAWFNCLSSGCGELDEQLGKNYLQACMESSFLDTGFASIEVDGWVTVSDGTFGHLGSYPREFFADRIISVSPPPQAVVDELIERYQQYGICD